MTDVQIVPPVAAEKTAGLQGKRGNSGDGGNRTHAPFPSSDSALDSQIAAAEVAYEKALRHPRARGLEEAGAFLARLYARQKATA